MATQPKSHKAGSKRCWSGQVTATSDATHPPDGLFKKDAATIARTLRVEEGFAEGREYRDADADVLHQSCRKEHAEVAAACSRKSEAVNARASGAPAEEGGIKWRRSYVADKADKNVPPHNHTVPP